MKSTEAAMLCRWVAACCPQQKFDEFSADAYYELLRDLQLDDCKAAVAAVARRQPFVAPAEIRAEVRRVRSDRIGRAIADVDPPPGLTVAEYQAWLRDTARQLGDGGPPPVDTRQLVRRPLELDLVKRVSQA